MRPFLFSVAALAVIAGLPALAADYPVLRGTSSPSLPPAPVLHDAPAPFDGFYVGGLAGYSSVNFNPDMGAADLARSRALRNTAVETEFQASRIVQPSQFSGRGTNFGGFLGYNMQIGEAVVGLEADYMRMGQRGTGSNTIARTWVTSPGYAETVGLSGETTAKLDDLVTLRARAGYAMGNVMPYLTGGLAMGFGTVSNRVSVRHTGVDADPACAPDCLPPFGFGAGGVPIVQGPFSDQRKNAFMFGFSGGAGIEAVYGGLLLRGEYLFSRVQAQGGVVIDVNQARVGAGVKF